MGLTPFRAEKALHESGVGRLTAERGVTGPRNFCTVSCRSLGLDDNGELFKPYDWAVVELFVVSAGTNSCQSAVSDQQDYADARS